LTDPSLKPDPLRKGSYYRRIEDIALALQELEVTKLPAATQFITYFFACEKLAQGVVGIVRQLPAHQQYRQKLRLADIKTAASAMNLPIQMADLDWLFSDVNEQRRLPVGPVIRYSARFLRNRLSHDFGPWNAKDLIEHAAAHIPRMQAFLACTPVVLAFNKTNFSHVA
jgi:hypothetical protein